MLRKKKNRSAVHISIGADSTYTEITPVFTFQLVLIVHHRADSQTSLLCMSDPFRVHHFEVHCKIITTSPNLYTFGIAAVSKKQIQPDFPRQHLVFILRRSYDTYVYTSVSAVPVGKLCKIAFCLFCCCHREWGLHERRHRTAYEVLFFVMLTF